MNNELHSIPLVGGPPELLSDVGLKPGVTVVMVDIHIDSILRQIKVDFWKLQIPVSRLIPVILKRLDIVRLPVFGL